MLNSYSNKYVMLKEEVVEKAIAKEITQEEGGNRLGVSRQTMSKWISRYRRFGTEGLFPVPVKRRNKAAHNKTDEKTENLVIEYAEKYWNHGVESLRDLLQIEQNLEINSSTIYRILKRRKIRYSKYWTGTKRRKKKKLYCHKEAGLEIQMDTKYPFGYKQGKVVYTSIDDASRWVFAKVYDTANGENTRDFIQHLIQRAPFTIQKIRTDCGTEFVNEKVRKYLNENNIQHRRNTPYCPEENGKIERFHGTLNQQAIQYSWYPSDSIEILEYKLQLFLQYYNYQKKHRGLGMNGWTPFQKLNYLAFSPLGSLSQNVNLTLQCNNS